MTLEMKPNGPIQRRYFFAAKMKRVQPVVSVQGFPQSRRQHRDIRKTGSAFLKKPFVDLADVKIRRVLLFQKRADVFGRNIEKSLSRQREVSCRARLTRPWPRAA